MNASFVKTGKLASLKGMRSYHVGMNMIAQHGMKVARKSEAPTMQRSVQSFGDAEGGISAKYCRTNSVCTYFEGFLRLPKGIVN